MNENADIAAALDRIAKAAAIPISAKWLDAEGVGAMLSYAPRYVSERLACRADFPKPARGRRKSGEGIGYNMPIERFPDDRHTIRRSPLSAVRQAPLWQTQTCQVVQCRLQKR